MKGNKKEPAKPVTIYERYRVTKDTYDLLGNPTEGRPKDWHLRDGSYFCWSKLAARGGKVVCKIIDGDYEGVGVAVCSYSDIFDKKHGYELACQRAEQALHLAKSLDVPLAASQHYSVTVEPRTR